MKSYPLVDTLTKTDLAKVRITTKARVRAVATSEFRKPKKGEWYLSGAVVEAYRAHSDLSANFRIAKLVPVKIPAKD